MLNLRISQFVNLNKINLPLILIFRSNTFETEYNKKKTSMKKKHLFQIGTSFLEDYTVCNSKHSEKEYHNGYITFLGSSIPKKIDQYLIESFIPYR